MQQLKLILTLIFLPLWSWAEMDLKNNPISGIISNSKSIFDRALHYKVISLDNGEITIENIVIGLVSLIIGLKIARYLSLNLKKKLFSIIALDNNSANIIGRLIDYTFIALIIMIVLDIAHVPITIFTFIGGALVISIGLSAQHLINNFISGIALIIENKVKVGDLIEFEDIIGRVSNIEARMLQITNQNNLECFIPHSKIMQERFINWSYNDGRVRVATKIKIDQKDNINSDFDKIVLNAVMQNRSILTTPKPQLLLIDFEDNLLHYEVNFWINLTHSDRRQVISEVNHNILNALRAHHIPLAVPSRRIASS